MLNVISRVAARMGLLALLGLPLFAPLYGQVTSGDLTGNVTDASGGLVTNADITVKNTATGVQNRTRVSGSGQYRVSNLPVGNYSLEVSASGFSTTRVENIEIDLSRTATVNVTLQVSGTTTTVDVISATTSIDTTSAQIQNTYETRQLSDLPIASGGATSGIYNLSLLNAGVATSGSVGAGSGPSVGGQRPRNNNFTLEGVNINSKSVTGPVVTVPNDAVSEFTVLQNQFSPEFGWSSGGQFNQAVRSGTNEFHGRVYEYFENRNLNAMDNLTAISGLTENPRYDANRFGGQIGGPILKNKLFFFANFDYNPVGQASVGGAILAPTTAGYGLLANDPNISQANLRQLQQYLPGVATATAAPVVVNGQSIPLGQFTVSGPNYTNYTSGLGAIDYTISEKDSIRGRFVYNKNDAVDAAAQLPQFYTISPTRSYAVTVNEYHNFSPTLINEFRLGYNRQNQDFPAGNFTWPGLDAFPNIQINELNINIGPDPNAPQFGIQNIYQGTDNLTWTKGAHTIKFGVDFQKSIAPQSFTQRARGDYEWETLAGYLTDIYPDYLAQRSLGSSIYYGDQTTTGGFFNDNWKLRPNLTVNLGLRYEFQTVPYSMRRQDVNLASSVPGLISFAKPYPQTDNFMPRIGIAWVPGKEGKTVIRSGFGINYDQIYDNLGLLTLPPQVQQTIDVTGTTQAGFLAGGGIPPGTQTGGLSVADARAATSGFVPNQKRPKSLQWNFGVQRSFGEDYTFEVRYVGTRGLNLPMQIQLNRSALINSSNALPLFYSQPSQATLDALPTATGQLVDTYSTAQSTTPAFAAAGFTSPITAYMPVGVSTYHGLATQLNRRFRNGMNFTLAYTLSHNIDNSTADVFSTNTTPRRPQDFNNLSEDRASSALDHRHRLTASLLYDLPFFKGSNNWFMKNLLGNWQVAPIYTYQSGTVWTVQSGSDVNLNGDGAPDRGIVNSNGVGNTSSGVTALTNTAGTTVGYLADNPTARFIAGAPGLVSNIGRNTMALNPINSVDLTLVKRFNIKERYSFELQARAFNVFNHSQYTGGFLNDVRPAGTGCNACAVTGAQVLSYVTPGSGFFNQPDQIFSSNPRTMQITAKFNF
jgi:hypothetical protein